MSCHTRVERFTYQRVRDTIENMLTYGELAIGDRLPPIRELAERFGCNYHTVRKGMESLIREEFLESRSGSGVFVRGGSRTIPTDPAAPGADSALAVVCHPPMSPTDVRFIAALHESAEKREFNLELHTVSSFAGPERIFDRIVLRGCSAILLPLLRSDDHIEEIARCIGKYPVPFVVGTSYPGLERYCYESHEVFGLSTQRAVEMVFLYFLRLGYGNIALLLPAEQAARTVLNYVTGYMEQCKKHDIAIRLELCEQLPGAADALLRKWEKQRGDIALICYDDDIAVRLMESARRAGWEIPGELALTGLGDTPVAAGAMPALSSVTFPFDYVTDAIVDCALALKSGGSAQLKQPVYQELVVRESCGGLRRIGREGVDRLLKEIRSAIQEQTAEEDV